MTELLRIPVPHAPDLPATAPITLEAELRTGPRALGVVVCHPLPAFGGNMHTPFIGELTDALADAGFSTLRFNFRGVGQSTGEATGGRTEHADVTAALAFLQSRSPLVALCGYSFGALMALRSATHATVACAGVAIGLPTVLASGKPDREAALARAMGRIPWLLLSGANDQFSVPSVVRSLAADAPATAIEILDGVGHFYSPTEAARISARLIVFLSAFDRR